MALSLPRAAAVALTLAVLLHDPAQARCKDDQCTELRAAIGAQRRAADAAQEQAIATDATLYRALRLESRFEFQAGDVLLLRSDELISAAISQLAESPAFFSHMAIVGFDPQWRTFDVVEAGLDEGLRVVALDDWLDRPAVRFAVYRHRDAGIAHRAAIAALHDAQSRRGAARAYDLAFDLDDAAKLYCSEVVRRAFAMAAPQQAPVPMHLSDVGALVDTFPLAALGLRSSKLFMPDDLELDARFDHVLELRAPQTLPRAAATDAALRRVFDALRGPQREAMLAQLDASTAPSKLGRVPQLLRSGHASWRQLPEPTRSRLAALAQRVADETEMALAAATP